MKIIELLNKIANGEEMPEKIKFLGVEYIYNNRDREYKRYNSYSGNYYGLGEDWRLDISLNDEVEVIEEKEMCHKCGKYPAEYNQTYCEFCLGISEEDKKIEKADLPNYFEIGVDKHKDVEHIYNQCVKIHDNTVYLEKKLNEIIDKINKGE